MSSKVKTSRAEPPDTNIIRFWCTRKRERKQVIFYEDEDVQMPSVFDPGRTVLVQASDVKCRKKILFEGEFWIVRSIIRESWPADLKQFLKNPPRLAKAVGDQKC